MEGEVFVSNGNVTVVLPTEVKLSIEITVNWGVVTGLPVEKLVISLNNGEVCVNDSVCRGWVVLSGKVDVTIVLFSLE